MSPTASSRIGFVGLPPASTIVAKQRYGTIPPTSQVGCCSFNGQAVGVAVRPRPAYVTSPSTTTKITMKKGRMPRHMMPQRQGQQQQQQNVPLPEDGTPVFALFVRTERTKIWYPLGAVKGDDRSKNMVDALKGGFAKGLYQQALDRGMAQTLYGKEGTKYVQGALRLYPQLKKYTKDLQFGYKVAAVGLDEQPTKIVTKEMAGTMFSKISKGVGDFFKNLTPGGDKDSDEKSRK